MSTESTLVGPPGVRPLTEREFTLFRDYIEKEAGILLTPVKKALLVARLSGRMRQLAMPSFTAYYDYLQEEGAEEERVRMLDCICTNETHFFREPHHFRFIEDRVAAELRAQADAGQRSKRVRVWSAACSSGEEPYSLAMTLLELFPPSSGWEVEVLATDLSTKVLARAREATWPMEKTRDIPMHLLKAYCLKGTGAQEGRFKMGPLLRETVRFARLNLNEPSWPVNGPFDLVFCRNALIYFGQARKAEVVTRLLSYLAPTGYFFLGHAESLAGMQQPARAVMPTIYAPLASPGGAVAPVRAAARAAGGR
jgi:chemotaxis protein methyltransferase CheR